MHPIGPGFIQCRCATGPVFVCRAPKRLTLEGAAMAGHAVRRIDLLPPGDQSKIIGVGEVAAPTPFNRSHVS